MDDEKESLEREESLERNDNLRNEVNPGKGENLRKEEHPKENLNNYFFKINSIIMINTPFWYKDMIVLYEKYYIYELLKDLTLPGYSFLYHGFFKHSYFKLKRNI